MRTKVIIEMIDENCKPVKAHKSDACFDLFAAQDIIVFPFETVLIRAGFRMQLEEGYEAQIRPRSGNSLKKGFQVILGTIDCGYTGEVGIIVHHMGGIAGNIMIKKGDKIAQMAISRIPDTELEFSRIKMETERGEGGFGSTDRK